MKKNIWTDQHLMFCIMIGVICFGLLLLKATLHPAVIIGDSMNPTYKDGWVISSSVYEEGDSLQAGDVVIFHTSAHKQLIKRVVAVGGDTVQIKYGILYRNGEKTEEIYPQMEDAGIAADPITLNTNEIFCLGDNRNNSTDSRKLGCISLSDVDYVVREVLIKW